MRFIFTDFMLPEPQPALPLEDVLDLEAARQALEEPGPNIPWPEVRKTLGLGGLVLLLTGCASADPGAWQLYAKASYFYGRMEAKTELLCAPPRNPNLADFCREAADTQKRVREIAPTIEAELAKEKADWAAIGKYLDLVLGLASKAL